MAEFKDVIQKADWKQEKHVPVIECPDTVSAGQNFDVQVCVGKEVAHPNATEHHIRWIELFFLPEYSLIIEIHIVIHQEMLIMIIRY